MRVIALLPLLALPLISCVVSYKVSSVDPTRHELSSASGSGIFYHIKPVADKEHASVVGHFAGDLLGVINLANPLMWAEYPAVARPYLLADPWENLQRKLGSRQLFLQATASESPPEKGIYLFIDAVYLPQTKLGSPPPCPWGILSGVTLGIIPYYCDETGVNVRYDLYVDRQLKQSYQYEIGKKGMAGLLILPFAWLNLFTDDLADAIVLTTREFILDASRDGYL